MLWRLDMVSMMMIRETSNPADYVLEGVLNFPVAQMAVMRKDGTLVPVTAHVEVRVLGRCVSNMFESNILVLHYVTFATPWDQVEGAASRDLVLGQRRREICNRGGMDGCHATSEDEDSCPPHGGRVEIRTVWLYSWRNER